MHDSNESPTNAPHSCGQEPQNARIPHLLGTQRAANKVINPHQSPTYPGVGGVGVYFDWCIIVEVDYSTIFTELEVIIIAQVIIRTTVFSFILFIFSSEASRNRTAATLKISA